jgi:hypothetical protein
LDIHKPKAAHSVREFAIEIGTIICGILIALALEQAVEWSHGQKELREAREAITQELTWNATSLQTIAEQETCIDTRLDLLTAWANGKAQIQSANLASIDNRPLLRNLRFTAWDIAKTSAVAAHMPVAEQLSYAAMYELLANEKGVVDSERRAWLEFGRYAGETRLDPETARRLRGDVGMARANASARRINMPPAFANLAKLGVKPGETGYPPGRSARDLCEAPK